MRPVKPAPEPQDFDAKVRQPGLSALAELVGEPPLIRRPGRKRRKLAESRDAIPADKFPPFWTEATEDLLAGYQRICSYVGVYIEHVTGHATVDHMAPKSRHWDRAYEWDNYRLACGLMNSRKGAILTVLDPFLVQAGWFGLEFTECLILPGPNLSPQVQKAVEDTIRELDLNDWNCRQLRLEYVRAYESGDISWDYLTRRAPFIADEMRRQGRQKPRV